MGTDDLFKKKRAKRRARKAETIEPKADSYLIVTEGTKTEPWYFDSLAQEVRERLGGRLDVPLIETSGEGRGTMSLVEKAAEIVNRSPVNYQHVWVVFDKDDFADFGAAIVAAKDHGFSVAWSNQCFEYWLFLHFDYSDASLDRGQWIAKLDELFWQGEYGRKDTRRTSMACMSSRKVLGISALQSKARSGFVHRTAGLTPRRDATPARR